MRAAVYTKTSSGKVLEIQDLDQPVPKDNEVLLSIRAASVNPLDWRMKSQRPGVDVAGEVVSVGGAVTQFKPGDPVFGVARGAFAEFVCAPENKICRKPDRVTFEQAAAIPVAALTALQGLRDQGHLQPGQKVLINGAAGGVGTFAVQIAKSLGATVTAVCSTKNVDMVRSLGADRVIDYTCEDFAETPDRYHLILDNVGNRPLAKLKRILVPRGTCVLAGAGKHLPAALTRIATAFLWSPFSREKFRFFIANVNRADLKTLADLMASGTVTPIIDRRYPLPAAAQALAYVEEGHARAKVIIVPQ